MAKKSNPPFLCSGDGEKKKFFFGRSYQRVRGNTSNADYISCDVTSSDVDHVTLLHMEVVSATSDEIGDVASTSLGLIPWKVVIVATVLTRKFHKNFQNFH